MSEQEKKRQRIYGLLNAEPEATISERIGVSLWPSLSPGLNLLGAFKET